MDILSVIATQQSSLYGSLINSLANLLIIKLNVMIILDLTLLLLRGMEAKRRAEETRVALASFSARDVP